MANNLNTMRRRNLGFTGVEGEMFNDSAMPVNALAGYQPMNTIRASSGEYITPEGGRSAMPARFGGNSLRQPVIRQMSGQVSGDDLSQMAILANRSPQQAAMAARRFLQANPDFANEPGFSEEELSAGMADNTFSDILGQKAKSAYTQEAARAKQAMSPSDVLAREKFEWEKGQRKSGADVKPIYDTASNEWVYPPDEQNPQGRRTGDVAKYNAVTAAKNIINEFRGTEEKPGLIKTMPTGGWLGLQGMKGRVTDSQKAKEFDNMREAISTQMRAVFRIPGEGSLSDKEQAQYGLQLPDINNDADVNERILRRMENALETRASSTAIAPNVQNSGGAKFLGFE